MTRLSLLFVGASLFAALLAGCGNSSPGAQVDVPRLEQELQTVIHLEKLTEGFDFTVHAACHPTDGGGLQFSCRIDATTPDKPINSWTELVSCRQTDPGDVPRCGSSSGDALQ